MKLALLSSFVFILAATSAMLQAAPISPSTPEEHAVLAPIHKLFEGMSRRDAVAIKDQVLPGGGLVLMRDGKPVQMSFDDFADRVSKPGNTQTEERIYDPVIRIDNDLAVVWAPFSFFVNGKVDHCGTDLFSLVRVSGQWLIASVADTGRKVCPVQ